MNKLPSKYQIKDRCNINFGDSGSIRNARVTKVHFTESKVTYDFEVLVDKSSVTRMHNIDSSFVFDVE